MDYIYDIVLNFQDKYYDYYEWYHQDKLMNIKKVAIYKIYTKDYLNIKNNEIIIDKSSLPKQNKIYLLTEGNEVMGIMLDKDGKVIKKSSLLFYESDDILTDKDDITTINIKYHITKKIPLDYSSRINKEKITFVNNYLKNINKIKDEYLLKYIYYDIYNIEESNIDTIYDNLLSLTKTNLNKIYNSIININKELNKEKSN